MITRCPSCRTAFKVVPDQLRIAAGWVRCGHCGELFDGRSHLVDATPEPRPSVKDDVPLAFRAEERPLGTGAPVRPRAIEPDSREPGTEADFQPTLAMGPEEQSLVERLDAQREQALQREAEQRALVERQEAERQEAERQEAERQEAERQEAERQEAERQEAERQEAERLAEARYEGVDPQAAEMPGVEAPAPIAAADVFPRSPAEADESLASGFTAGAPPLPDEGQNEPRFRFDPPLADEPLGLLAAPPIAADTAPAEPPHEPALSADPFMGPRGPAIDRDPAAGHDALPSFVHAPRVHRLWDSATVRALLWTALPVLVIVLAAQWVLHERDWLAARTPALVPLLNTLCAPLGCAVQPYRMLNAIAIDGSDFKAIDADTFRFDLSVRNGADVAVAMPSFQLTLSDLQGQVLVRRVIRAAELDAPASLKAHGEFDVTRALHIAGVAHPEAITSYRVVAFYP